MYYGYGVIFDFSFAVDFRKKCLSLHPPLKLSITKNLIILILLCVTNAIMHCGRLPIFIIP